MSSWTEGEWTADDQYVLAKGQIIGKARHCDWPGKTLYENYQEACANARMFAASKDLYEALAMVMARGRIDDSESAMNQVAAALAKARGD